MKKRSFLVSAIFTAGILASTALTAIALPAAAPRDAIVHAEVSPPTVEKAYWGWHRHYWHRHYWHPHYWHRYHWHRWHHWRRW